MDLSPLAMKIPTPERMATAFVWVVIFAAFAFTVAMFLAGCSGPDTRPGWEVGLSADQIGNQQFKATVGGKF